jgi:hypothetical protein
LLDSEFDSTLGDKAKVSTGEAMCLAGDVVEIDILRDWSLSELSFQNADTRGLVWQRNVNKSVKTTWTAEGVVELFWSIRGSDDENVLLRGHAVHFCKKN